MKKNLPFLLLGLLAIGCKTIKEPQPDFSFAFMTDIHMTPDKSAPQGFQQAIDTVNKLKPDFVITGGDLVMDALGQTRSRADSLYQLYGGLMKGFNMPVHNTVGNHELFAFYNKNIDTLDVDYGEGMFRRYFGNPWKSFDYKGWHFILLKSIEPTYTRGYYGNINPVQMEWLKQDLAKVNDKTPVVVSVHIPFITVYNQWQEGGQQVNGGGSVITNGKEVMDMLRKKNLKLVLQGHQHYYEDLFMDGVHFITGGAVSAGWWGGALGKMEEGFMLIKVYGDQIKSEYVDFGWIVKE
ncbi:MAG: metallophosphoesterase [Bacteroidia bacterium]|nr:metallophosphoesterase [Bacteroidia bacterium]